MRFSSSSPFPCHLCARNKAPPLPPKRKKKAFYAQAIENRVGDILKALNLADVGKSNAVHDILVNQYHELRIRDAAIDTCLKT